MSETRDDFLGGRLHLWQPKVGYRAGVDPVLLAAAVPARAGQSVLELGIGAGAALFCLATRVSGLALCGVEVQPEYAALARRNADANGIAAEVVEADLGRLPGDLRQRRFSHVIANPPYFRAGAHSPAANAGKAIAMGGETPLETWIAVAARRLAPKGYLHVIQRTERLPELLAACAGRLGSVEALPIAAREGRPAGRVVLRARKGGAAEFRLLAPLILHSGASHLADGDDYSDQAAAILRQAEPLNWSASGGF